MEKKLYTVNEVLEYLRISRPTLYRMIKQGVIHSVKIGKRTLFKESELTRFIDNLTGSEEK